MTERTNQTADQPNGTPRYYEHRWPFTFLPAAGTQSLDEMILMLQSRLDTLREMRAADVDLHEVVHAVGGCDLFPEFDHVVLITTDLVVAKRFGFEPVQDDDHAEDEFDPTES